MSVISASLDKSDGRMFVHVYTVTESFERRHVFVGLPKIVGKPDAANLTALFIESLMNDAQRSETELRRPFACIAADGAAVLLGDIDGLIARVHRQYAPLAVGNHCCAHKLQLAAKNFKKDSLLMSVVGLCASAFSFFHCSLNRKDELASIQAEFKVRDGQKNNTVAVIACSIIRVQMQL